MAIARDSNAAGVTTAASPFDSTALTIGSNTSGLLIVGVIVRDGDNLSGVTWNGVALTQGLKYNTTIDGAGGTKRYLYIYYLYAPATGNKTLSISYGATYGRVEFGAIAYTGVSQTGFPDATATNVDTGTATSLSTTLTTVAANCWGFGFAYVSATPLGGTNMTLIDDNSATGSSGSFDSNTTLATGGNTMQIQQSSGGPLAIALASFAPGAPVVAGTARVEDFMLLRH